ncbi:MAG: hypothetical protein IT581_06455 [Verrucomicrobiales bacterium]|nr:hypothetical protein [Verrucomicrobiales bacterium]
MTSQHSPIMIVAQDRRTTWGRYASMIADLLRGQIFFPGDPMDGECLRHPKLVLGSPNFVATALLTLPRTSPTMVYTSWETTRVPEVASDILRSASKVVVPSRFCQNVFAATCDIEADIVPHGVAGAFLETPAPKPFIRRTTIGIGGAWMGAGERKRLQYLVRIFHTIKECDDVILRVRTGCLPPWAQSVEVAGHRIQWDIGDKWSASNQVEWFDSLDGFMTISAGEGYDLMSEEAIARGLPVAGTDWGGTSERHLTVRLPYSMVDMRGIAGFYPEKSLAALVSDDGIQFGFERLLTAIRNRRGTRVVPCVSGAPHSIAETAERLKGLIRRL